MTAYESRADRLFMRPASWLVDMIFGLDRWVSELRRSRR